MLFFKRNKIKKDMIQNIRPTSKAALKMQCLYSCNGDIEKADKLYSYMIKDMEDLPTYDIVPPSSMQQFKEGAIQTFGWINQNQDTIMNWIGMIKDMFGRGGNNGMPPMPNAAPASPIPSINQ